jgi:RNA polymerase sigma-70 factor (ECF subfamily)
MSDFVTTGNVFCPAVEHLAEETFHMDEERFRAFYERTSRPLWAYLSRLTGDRTAADDLVQESYYRLLRVKLPEVCEAQLKNYLFRIATNLVRDEWRKRKTQPAAVELEPDQVAAHGSPTRNHGQEHEHRAVLEHAMSSLKPRERELLWLAYVEGSSHQEISEVCGLKTNSIRPLLLRARRKLATALRLRVVRGRFDHA